MSHQHETLLIVETTLMRLFGLGFGLGWLQFLMVKGGLSHLSPPPYIAHSASLLSWVFLRYGV